MIIQMWDGIPLQITLPMVESFNKTFGKYDYESFPASYCGAGNGFGEKLIPDYVYGYTRILPGFLDISIKLSPACKIHDDDYELAPPTWEAFHEANSRLYANTKSIIVKKTNPGLIKRNALRYPAIYSQAVDAFGRGIFWRIKRAQGFSIPPSALWLLEKQ